MPNPTTGWDRVPIYGKYGIPVTPDAATTVPVVGSVRVTMMSRVYHASGRTIYPRGATLDFPLSISGEVAFGLPALDDPDVLGATPYKVEERFVNAQGATSFIEPTLAMLGLTPAGLDLTTVIVPDDGPTLAPPTALLKGVPGGVAALDSAGRVLDASGQVVQSVDVSGLYARPGAGIPSTDLATAVQAALSDTRTPTDSSVTNAKVASGAGISADKLADGTALKVLTAAERTKLSGVATGATANATDASLRDAAQLTGTVNVARLPDTYTSTSAASTRITVEEGRYRRTLSELRSLAANADARPLIEAALAVVGGTSGAELVLPEGEWVMSSAASASSGILVTTSGVTLRGAGRNKTKISATVSRNAIDFQGTSGTPLADVSIHDLTITGMGSASGSGGNQRLLNLNYVNGIRMRNVTLSGSGNNGLNMFYCGHGLIEGLEISDCRDFGTLMYRSNNLRFIDPYIHDIGVAGRANLGLQFKSSQNCAAIRPRLFNIQGYGFYTWDDSLDLVNYPDTGHWLIDPHIVNMMAGGTFSATAVYINVTPNMHIRGGRYRTSAGGLISCVGTKGLRISDIPEMTGAASSAIGISGAGTDFRISNVHADGQNTSNPIGIIVSGTPAYGSLRDSSFVNGAAGGSTDNAACRIESTATGLVIEHNDFSDYGGTPTQRRGIYDRTTGGNYWRLNKATGNTGTNKTIPVGSEDFQFSPTRPVVLGTVTTAQTFDTSAGLVQTMTLGANIITVTAISNGVVGAELTLILTQDATGSRLVTWPATVSWAGGTAPTLSTAATKVDVLRFVYDGTKWREVSRSLGQ